MSTDSLSQPRNDNVSVLSEWAPAVSQEVLLLPGGDAEVFTVGDGPPLLLLHPLNVGAGVFARLFADLARHYRVICVHNPGVGATTWKQDLTLAGLACFQREVLDELAVEPPFHVFGACFGGTLAREFVLRHPDESASLALVGAIFRPGEASGVLRSLPSVAAEEFDLMAGPGGAGLEGERADLEDLLLRSESMNTWLGLAYLQMLASKPSFAADQGEIAVPTLVLRGQLDTMIDAANAGQLGAVIPGARLVEMTGTGHFPYLTHPEAFGRVLFPFLDQAASPQVIG